MIALIVQSNPYRAAATTAHLMRMGFQVMTVESLPAAEAMSHLGIVDLMVLDERINGDLTHKLILSAERRNPGLTALMLTSRKGPEADELYLLLPALYALLPYDAEPAMIAKLVSAGLSYAGENLHRILSQDDTIPVVPDAIELIAETQAEPALSTGQQTTLSTLLGVDDMAPPAKTGAGFQSIRTPVMH